MLKLTIRELLLLTLVVSVALGWWLDRHGLTTAISRHKSREDVFALYLAQEGWEIRRWDGGSQLLMNGDAIQFLP